MINHDVVNPISLECTKIWHLACPASPVHYQANPIKTAKTSFLGTLNMLGLAKKNNAKILLASTSEVYGDPEIHPQPESYRGCVNTHGIEVVTMRVKELLKHYVSTIKGLMICKSE